MNEEKNQIAEAIIKAACYLGNGDAMTSMGAIEALGLVHKEGMESIADALNNISVSIDGLARAIEEKE